MSQDDARAAELHAKACEGGTSLGCYYLGKLRLRGGGVAKDEAGAATVLTKSCEGKPSFGCAELGVLYDQGRG